VNEKLSGQGIFQGSVEIFFLDWLFILTDIIIWAQLPGPAAKILAQTGHNLFYTMRSAGKG
jgi:hypothetical protein